MQAPLATAGTGHRLLLPAAFLLSAVVLGPALGVGYVLHGDQVFVPIQDLLPWMLGVGAGLPRAVPQDAVVAVLSGPVPGWLLEKAALVGSLVLLAIGTGRLVRSRGVGPALVAGLVVVWSAYVAERLLLGHWSLLLAVAAMPWALEAARDTRSAQPGSFARWLLWVALASLTATGGLLVLLSTLPAVLWTGTRATIRRRLAAAALALALQLPWLVPSLLHPGAKGGGASGADVFAARAEGPWGVLLTVLTTGGAWNATAVPASRTSWWGLVLALLVVVVASFGAVEVTRVLGRSVAVPLVIMSVAGIAWCVVGSWTATSPAASWLVETLPGGGLLRDAHKWLAPWVLLLAVAAALGAARLAASVRRATRDRAAAAAVLVGVAILPLAAMPDLAWGASGRLAAVDYPDDLAAVRAALLDAPAGDVVSLPWQTFRAFPWNDAGRVSLDPVPRALPRTVLASGTLLVRRGNEIVVIEGDDPRAAEVDAARAANEPLGPVLASLGVSYAVVASDVPDAARDLPPGSRPLVAGDSFSLYALSVPASKVPDRPLRAAMMAFVGYGLVVGGAASVLVASRLRHRGAVRAVHHG